MSLLEIITRASPTVSTKLAQESTNYPIVLNSEPIFSRLKPDEDQNFAVKKVTGWEITQTDTELLESRQKFFKDLSTKLKSTKKFTKDDFLGALISFLEKSGEKCGIPVGGKRSKEGYTRNLIEKLGFLIRDVNGLVLEACMKLGTWDVLETLISNGLVEYTRTSDLVSKLIEKRRSDLIVSCLKQVLDLQTYDLLCILKYFLVLPSDGYQSLVSLRKYWENQALLAIEKASGKGKEELAKEASVLVMLAHDGFDVSELCLHYLLSSRNLDEVIFSACVGKLNGEEIKALVSYLGKWLRKYDKFPQAVPCPKASSVLGLTVCDWVPTLEDVVKCFGIVVDEHFSTLVLNSEFHEELRSLEAIVSSLTAEARLSGTLANLSERLTSELNG